MKMTEREFKNNYEQICNLLSERKLKPAFDLLEQLIRETGHGELRDKYIDLESKLQIHAKIYHRRDKRPRKAKNL